ncbi:T cell receptor alpha chain MC.7.G5 isoform X2 [Chelonia mydas]|uniref:T cell receptor alpha chain MC.7.G5 isoform X2 n=1 Tax=Chelonia mydas TaxID=8469 RepID=UPI0018A1F4E2|nr:T cell receptor alpha chain MC.7.G5 isoform X2 [Chelonia mydas]
MSHHIVGMILVYLRMAASEEGIQILQRPAQLWLTSGQTAHLDCRISKEEWRVRWYKEQQNGSLHGIHQSSQSESLDGKYLSNVNITANTFSLLISNVQRDDSGVYYCGLSASVYLQPNFGNGTRLIVTGDCGIVFYAGLPCIFILLLIQLLILLWRKCPIRGRAVQRGNQIPMRQMPQTEYATLMYSNRNAPL